MAIEKRVLVPDIGDFEGVEVIEILVTPGDRIEVESSLVTLESDKASMEIPSPVAGEVQSVSVKVGDRVSEGSLLLTVSVDDGAQAEDPQAVSAVAGAEPVPTADDSPPDNT